MNATSKKPGLSAGVDAAEMAVVLRVDAIQRGTLTAMARTVAESVEAEDDVHTALMTLGEVVTGDASGPEEDAHVEALEEAACLDYAAVEIGLADAVRLRAELDAAIARLSRFNPAAADELGGRG
ncbi:hypothetical protein, partial [Streptomyces boncukensis]